MRGADNPYTSGVICNKVARYAERVHHPDRLLYPMLRTGPKGSGQFRRIGWDEALDRVVAGFSDATARHGSEAVWAYSSAGTMGLVHRDGIFRLRHAMRWSGRKGTICTTIATAGWTAGCGRVSGSDSREMAVADLNVLWGTNPVSTQVNVMAHVTRARKERGAKLVVIDPYRTGSGGRRRHAPGAAPRHGCGAGLRRHALRLPRRPRRPRLHGRLHRRSRGAGGAPARRAARTGRPASPGWPSTEIEAFAALYNATPRAYIRAGYGFTRGRNGAASMHAVTCLPAVTGKWRHEGGGALWGMKGIYHWDKSLIEGTALRDPSVRELDMSRIASILTGDADALLGGPPVQALLVQSGNPASVCPDSNRVLQGLLRDDLFTVVHEQFMTETARYADIVLPATMFLEHDDIYQAGGHSHIQIGRQIVDGAGRGALQPRPGLRPGAALRPGRPELPDDGARAGRRHAAGLRLSRGGGADGAALGRRAAAVPSRRISSTASATPTGGSASARTGGRWATRRAGCRPCPTGSR